MSLLAAVLAAAPGFVATVPPQSFPLAVDERGALVAPSRKRLRYVSASGSVPIGPGQVIGAALGTQEAITVAGTEGASISDCAGGCPATQGQGDGYGEQQGTADTSATTVRVGPVGERLRVIARCPRIAAQGVAPVAAGSVLAWRDCDGASLAVRAAGTTTAVPAGGTVVALSAGPGRLTWAAVRDGAPTLVRAYDVATGTTQDVGTVRPLGNGPSLTLSQAADRLRVTLARQDGHGGQRCRMLDSVAGGPLAAVASRDCTLAQLTATGSIGAVPRTLRRPARIVVHAAGRARTIARAQELSFAASATRVAIVREGCARTTLMVRRLPFAGAPLKPARCPAGP